MADNLKQTGAGEILLPVERVTLTTRALKRKDGSPLEVDCEFIEEDRLIQCIEAVPGHAPVLGAKKAEDSVTMSRALLKYAAALLTLSCVLIGPDGTKQRPAFHDGEDPGDGSLPLRFVSDADKLRLIVATLRVSGFLGGPADEIAFRHEKREGGERGAGTVDAGEGDGAAAGEPAYGFTGEPLAPDAGARG